MASNEVLTVVSYFKWQSEEATGWWEGFFREKFPHGFLPPWGIWRGPLWDLSAFYWIKPAVSPSAPTLALGSRERFFILSHPFIRILSYRGGEDCWKKNQFKSYRAIQNLPSMLVALDANGLSTVPTYIASRKFIELWNPTKVKVNIHYYNELLK